jgi:hypothetical protein
LTEEADGAGAGFGQEGQLREGVGERCLVAFLIVLAMFKVMRIVVIFQTPCTRGRIGR